MIECFAVVDANNGSDHFWHDNHVTQVSLDDGWLLKWWSFFLCFAQLLDKSHRFAFQAAGESSAGTAVHQIGQLLVGHVQELVQIDSTEGEFTESTLLANLLFWCDLKREGKC